MVACNPGTLLSSICWRLNPPPKQGPFQPNQGAPFGEPRMSWVMEIHRTSHPFDDAPSGCASGVSNPCCAARRRKRRSLVTATTGRPAPQRLQSTARRGKNGGNGSNNAETNLRKLTSSKKVSFIIVLHLELERNEMNSKLKNVPGKELLVFFFAKPPARADSLKWFPLERSALYGATVSSTLHSSLPPHYLWICPELSTSSFQLITCYKTWRIFTQNWCLFYWKLSTIHSVKTNKKATMNHDHQQNHVTDIRLFKMNDWILAFTKIGLYVFVAGFWWG